MRDRGVLSYSEAHAEPADGSSPCAYVHSRRFISLECPNFFVRRRIFHVACFLSQAPDESAFALGVREAGATAPPSDGPSLSWKALSDRSGILRPLVGVASSICRPSIDQPIQVAFADPHPVHIPTWEYESADATQVAGPLRMAAMSHRTPGEFERSERHLTETKGQELLSDLHYKPGGDLSGSSSGVVAARPTYVTTHGRCPGATRH